MIPLQEREYEKSTTYRKYTKYIGKLVKYQRYNPTEEILIDFIFVIQSVVPQKWYKNRFAFKLAPLGEHQESNITCVKLLGDLKANEQRKINDRVQFGWQLIE